MFICILQAPREIFFNSVLLFWRPSFRTFLRKLGNYLKLYYQPETVWRRKLLRFLDAVTVLIGPWARSRWYKLQSCCSSQKHKFVPVVVELTGCLWCGLTETRRGRPSGQEVDAMRKHPPAETSVVLLMQERFRQLQHRDQRKVSVCNGAHILPRSLSLSHPRTRALKHDCSWSSSWVFWLQTTAASQPPLPESANLPDHMMKYPPHVFFQTRSPFSYLQPCH